MTTLNITYRRATLADLSNIIKFVDFWLSGRAASEGCITGAADYFVPCGLHKHYIRDYTTFIATNDDELVAWSVVQKDGTLIHLLVSGDYRGCGIGSRLMQILNPSAVRSKTDQSTGNPNAFYERLGYTEHGTTLLGKYKNIDVLRKPSQ